MQYLRNSRLIQRIITPLVSVAIIAAPLPSLASTSFASDFTLSQIDQRDTRGGLPPLPNIDKSRIRDELEYLEYGAYEIAQEYDAADYRFDDLLESLDFDPLAAFRYVRDEIRFEPYSGILRGPKGALGGRAANAYDKSLLLKDLLDHMGVEARLVYGTLEDKEVEILRQQALRPAADVDYNDSVAGLAGMSVEMRERMLSRAITNFEWISESLQEEGGTPKRSGQRPNGSDIRNHVWIEARIDADWQALDSTFADAEPGEAYAEPERYSLVPANEDRHKIILRIVAEWMDKEGFSDKILLEHEMAATVAADTRAYLTFAPRNATLGGKLAAALGTNVEFVPVLMLDGMPQYGSPVPGIRVSNADDKSFFFGASELELSALYIDIRTELAGTTIDESRTVLIDRLPAGVRRSGRAEMADLSPMPLEGHLPVDFKIIHQIMVSNGGRNPRLDAENIGLAIYFVGKHLLVPGAIDELQMDSVLWPAAIVRQAQLGVNERLLAVALNDSSNARFYIGEPRVYIASLSVREGKQGMRYAMSVDLVHDPIYAITDAEAKPGIVYERRMWHGVIQASFETTMVEIPGVVQPNPSSGAVSAITRSGGDALIITDPEDQRLSGDVPAALFEDLDSGKTVIVRKDAIEGDVETWWAVAPDGTTRAMLRPSRAGTSYFWWDGYVDQRLPKPYSGKVKVHYVDMEAMDEYAKKVSQQTKESATKRLQAEKKLPDTKKSRGGTEYEIVLNISILSTLGVAGITAATLVALSIIGTLYMIGYVIVAERQRKMNNDL